MTILSAETILLLDLLDPIRKPWVQKWHPHGAKDYGTEVRLSGGLGVAGYDLTLDHLVICIPPQGFALLSAQERFQLPNNVAARIHDKSSWARLGLTMQNTFVDPGFKGFLTLEATNHSKYPIHLEDGLPIAQVVFEMTDIPTAGYAGKYQNQERGPQTAR